MILKKLKKKSSFKIFLFFYCGSGKCYFTIVLRYYGGIYLIFTIMFKVTLLVIQAKLNLASLNIDF